MGTSIAPGEGGKGLERRGRLVVLDLAQVADVQPGQLGDGGEGQAALAAAATNAGAHERPLAERWLSFSHGANYAYKQTGIDKGQFGWHDLANSKSRLATANTTRKERTRP